MVALTVISVLIALGLTLVIALIALIAARRALRQSLSAVRARVWCATSRLGRGSACAKPIRR